MYLYKLAQTPKDYAACRRLVKESGQEVSRFGWPTMIAFNEDGKPIGVIGTHRIKGAVVCGPLATSLKSLRFVLSLISSYEKLLISCGVTSYLFSVESSNTRWLALTERWLKEYGGLKKFAENEDTVWYQRELTEHGVQS